MEKIELPSWVKREEHYTPVTDRESFISRSVLRLMQVLFKIKQQDTGAFTEDSNSVIKLSFVIFMVLLIVSSRNAAFLLSVFAVEMVCLSLLRGLAIRRILKASLLAASFCGLILLPAVLGGNAHTFTLLVIKTFLTVVCMSLLRETMPWNALTSGLRFLHVPHMFIFILDITMKYIVLLGEICLNMFEALALRSVGKNREKSKAVSGIAGAVFIKSKEMSEEMYQAMCCRGFTGEYHLAAGHGWHKKDVLYILGALFFLSLFIYLEGALYD